jgi:hypothetical protein
MKTEADLTSILKPALEALKVRVETVLQSFNRRTVRSIESSGLHTNYNDIVKGYIEITTTKAARHKVQSTLKKAGIESEFLRGIGPGVLRVTLDVPGAVAAYLKNAEVVEAERAFWKASAMVWQAVAGFASPEELGLRRADFETARARCMELGITFEGLDPSEAV